MISVTLGALGLSLCVMPDLRAQQVGPATISYIQGPDAVTPCATFSLAGVTPPLGAQFFGVPTTNVGFHEQFATLLTAAFNNKQVYANTTGQLVCSGYAAILGVWVQFP
jgi:hypothetical protein